MLFYFCECWEGPEFVSYFHFPRRSSLYLPRPVGFSFSLRFPPFHPLSSTPPRFTRPVSAFRFAIFLTLAGKPPDVKSLSWFPDPRPTIIEFVPSLVLTVRSDKVPPPPCGRHSPAPSGPSSLFPANVSNPPRRLHFPKPPRFPAFPAVRLAPSFRGVPSPLRESRPLVDRPRYNLLTSSLF